MGQRLPPDQMELHRRTDEVLHYIWDPIGIADVPHARDEYQGYLPTVFSYLVKGDKQGIRDYLLDVEENRMELVINQQVQDRTDRVIETLLAWKVKCLGG